MVKCMNDIFEELFELKYKSDFELLLIKIEEKDSDAMLLYSNLLRRGIYLEQNIEMGLLYLEESAKLNNVQALNELGLLYLHGLDFEVDACKGFEYFLRGAQLDDPTSLNNVAVCYEYGNGVEQSYQKAFDFYEKAVEAGGSHCHFKLGIFYYQGYIEKNWELSFEHMLLAAENGSEEALYNVAYSYQHAEGVDENLSLAFTYYKQLADDGYYKAAYDVGYMYINGDGVKQNFIEARKYLIIAIENDYDEAQELLDDLDLLENIA